MRSFPKFYLMPIITLYPPWANWIGLGWKTIETRFHDRLKNLAGKRIGIHVSLKWDEHALATASPYLTHAQRLATLGFLRVGGCISWTAFVSESRVLNSCDSQAALIDCGSLSIVRYGLFLTDVRSIEGIPTKGHQGIWYHEALRNVEEKSVA